MRGNDKAPATVRVQPDGSVQITPHQHHPQWGVSRPMGPVTLHKLSLHFYGSYSKWTLIRAANGLKDTAPSMPLHEALRVTSLRTVHRGTLTIPNPLGA